MSQLYLASSKLITKPQTEAIHFTFFASTEQAPDLPTLEANMQEAIRAYLKTSEPEEPLSDFVGTWRVEIAA